MTELSTSGRAALLGYMTDALERDSAKGLNKRALEHNPVISDTDLKTIIEQVCDALGREQISANGADRETLIDRLADLLDMTRMAEPGREITVRQRWHDSADPQPLTRQTSMGHAIMQGQKGSMTQGLLRKIRHTAGWQTLSQVCDAHAITHYKRHNRILDKLMEAYIERQVAQGRTREEAQYEMHKSYIAVTPHYKPVYKRLGVDIEDRGRSRMPDFSYDYKRPTISWVDLSPQAAEDFVREFEREYQESMHKGDIYALFTKHDIPYNRRVITEIIREIWSEEVERGMEKGAERPLAEHQVDRNFLNHRVAIMKLKVGNNVTQEAYEKIEKTLRARLGPEAERGNAR